jgi:hypothetical protein
MLEFGPGFSPEGRVALLTGPEAERRQSIGVAVLLVAIDPARNGDNISDPSIWTITELVDKPDTERSAGEISILAETRKEGEIEGDTVLAAMAEAFSDKDMPVVSGHLRLIDSHYRQRVIEINGHSADLVPVVFDGPILYFPTPAAFEEVRPRGWVKRSVLEKTGNLRLGLRRVLEYDASEGMIRSAMEAYYRGEGRQVFPPKFSIDLFYRTREVRRDVNLRNER